VRKSQNKKKQKMQLNNNIKVNKKYNIYFTDIKTFKEK